MASTATAQEITLRPPEPADTDDLARILFEAFGDIHDYHRFQRDFPAIEAAAMMMCCLDPPSRGLGRRGRGRRKDRRLQLPRRA